MQHGVFGAETLSEMLLNLLAGHPCVMITNKFRFYPFLDSMEEDRARLFCRAVSSDLQLERASESKPIANDVDGAIIHK